MLRRHLVDRRADLNVGPGRLLRPATGQERRAGPGMIAGPVGPGGGVDVVEPGDHLQLVAQRGERLHGRAELNAWPSPVGHQFP